MGSFPGHVIPGSFFSMFAIWWASQIPRRRLMCEQKRIEFFNTVTFPVPLDSLARLPVEGIVKMVFCTVGMACELYSSMDYGTVSYIKSKTNMQHFTMYSFFMLSGLVDCLTYSGWNRFTKGLDYIVMALAFTAEWVLFRYHLEEGDTTGKLHAYVHGLLLYVIAACVLITLVEYWCCESELASFMRSYCTLLQGTWFWQVAFILYPPNPRVKQWQDIPDDYVIATTAFAWHMIVDLILLILIYTFATCSYKRHCRIFDFHVERQKTSEGWTLKGLRARFSRSVRYSKIPTEEDENTLLDQVDDDLKYSDNSDVELTLN